MDTPNTSPPQNPAILGSDCSTPSEEQHNHRQAIREWQDQQAHHLKRQVAKARLKAFAASSLGSLLILGFLVIQVQTGRVNPPSLIMVPAALAFTLIVATLVLSPMPDVTKVLRQHKKNRTEGKRKRSAPPSR